MSYQVENSKSVHQEHDKVFRKILENKEEAAKFISKILNVNYEITEKDIEKYNSSFINNKFKSREADVIYRLKNRNVFFLIEHQTKIDYTMPLRILEYECAIMKSAIDIKQLGRKDYKLPMVISTVLYTGKRKWNAKKYVREAQEQLEGFNRIEFARYNVVDVNEISEEELLKDKSVLSKAMLIEKTKNADKLVECLEKIIEEMDKDKKNYKEEQRNMISTVIDFILRRKIGQEIADNMIEKLKGEDDDMLAVLEMIDRENRRIRRQGREEGRKENMRETAKRMLDEKANIEFIARITGLTEQEVEKLKQ